MTIYRGVLLLLVLVGRTTSLVVCLALLLLEVLLRLVLDRGHQAAQRSLALFSRDTRALLSLLGLDLIDRTHGTRLLRLRIGRIDRESWIRCHARESRIQCEVLSLVLGSVIALVSLVRPLVITLLCAVALGLEIGDQQFEFGIALLVRAVHALLVLASVLLGHYDTTD